MKKKKLCWYFQQSSFFFSLCYLILLLSLLQSSFKCPWQGLLRAWIQNNFCFVPPCINIHQDKFWRTVSVKLFSLLSLALMNSTPKHGKRIVKWWLFKIKLVELERTLIVWRCKVKVSQGLNNFLWQCRYIPQVAFL